MCVEYGGLVGVLTRLVLAASSSAIEHRCWNSAAFASALKATMPARESSNFKSAMISCTSE